MAGVKLHHKWVLMILLLCGVGILGMIVLSCWLGNKLICGRYNLLSGCISIAFFCISDLHFLYTPSNSLLCT